MRRNGFLCRVRLTILLADAHDEGTTAGAGLVLGYALYIAWDRPALGTCPLKCLGERRSWDMRFKMFGTGPLLGQAFVVPARIWLREQLCVRQWMNKGNILHLGVDVNKSL